MNEQHPSPFWTFSLQIYGKPGVPAACIVLQDGARVDVNVLLFMLFCARQGRSLAAADAHAIVQLIDGWKRDVVVPLRTARRALREPPRGFDEPAVAALRQRVKAIELEAERLQQETLFASLPVASLGVPAAPSAAARANTSLYADILGGSFDQAAVKTILDAFETIKDPTQ